MTYFWGAHHITITRTATDPRGRPLYTAFCNEDTWGTTLRTAAGIGREIGLHLAKHSPNRETGHPEADAD